MRYRNKPQLQERLAAEFVLGTLRGRARARFQDWMREDAALRRLVAMWEERLAPMADAVAPVAPPPRVWREIDARIASAPAAAPAPRAGFWDSVGFWRTTGLLATGMAAALLVTVVARKPQPVEVPVERVVEVPSSKMQPSYVAVLRDEAGKVVFMAYAARQSDELWIKKVGMDEPGEGKHYELWGLTMKPGEPPRSLGMIPPGESATIKLAAVADKSLAGFPALALSLEAHPGPRAAPVGPVIAKGDCQRFW